MLYNKNVTCLHYATPATKLLVAGVATGLASSVPFGLGVLLAKASEYFSELNTLEPLAGSYRKAGFFVLIAGVCFLILSLVSAFTLSDAGKMKIILKKGLFDPPSGNPLHFRDGEKLPSIKVKETTEDVFEITITATSCSIDELLDISPRISSILGRKFSNYAVTETNTDIAMNHVKFTVKDVTVDRKLTVRSVHKLKQDVPTLLTVQKDVFIDLTTSGSMLAAGKTRSGKTTGILCLLIQVLLHGRDKFGSLVIIIDPKQAELSRLPHTVTLDEDGGGKAILEAMKKFADSIVKRQKILNDLSEKKGDAVKWWDAGFHVSMLFIDEYVSARTIFPSKPPKDDPEYCLAAFDGLLKRIVTMGASAGCYAIISIAEASVSEGGLPAMIRSAMSTKILFRPTLTEGALMWDRDKLNHFGERTYVAGDAWFSSTDGKHDTVTFVHFPVMEFAVYREAGRLLQEYYRS